MGFTQWWFHASLSSTVSPADSVASALADEGMASPCSLGWEEGQGFYSWKKQTTNYFLILERILNCSQSFTFLQAHPATSQLSKRSQREMQTNSWAQTAACWRTRPPRKQRGKYELCVCRPCPATVLHLLQIYLHRAFSWCALLETFKRASWRKIHTNN